MSANPFISINEGMVFHKAKTEMGCLLLKRGIDIFSVKGLERGIQRRIQHPFITQAGRTAGRCNELFMQQKYLWFG